MVPSIAVGSHLVPFGPLWSYVVLCGHIWSSWVPYGQHALQGSHLVCLNSYQNSQDIYQDCQISQDYQ